MGKIILLHDRQESDRFRSQNLQHQCELTVNRNKPKITSLLVGLESVDTTISGTIWDKNYIWHSYNLTIKISSMTRFWPQKSSKRTQQHVNLGGTLNDICWTEELTRKKGVAD